MSTLKVDTIQDTNAVEMYQHGETTGSNKANRALAEGFWERASKKSPHQEELLFDPQTSGGLLLAVPESQSGQLVAELTRAGVQTAACVGKAVANSRPFVRVI